VYQEAIQVTKLYLEAVQGAVILDEKILLFVDGKVVAELTQKVGEMYRLHC
jgi:hypothetical protein